MGDQDNIILNNNTIFLNQLMQRRVFRVLTRVNPYYKHLYKAFKESSSVEDKNYRLVKLINTLEASAWWRIVKWLLCFKMDKKLEHEYKNQRRIIDRSNPKTKDYYSVAVILKNEARYVREYLLFYQATGVERVYLYDNESTDNLLNDIEPFINSGFVIYHYWPGKSCQTAAYRDVIRRTKKRTKWLAIVDSDEFLFSPKGDMKDQLKAYEKYPGIGVNWIVFGPNGHNKRPEGLVMDNYTTTFANYDETINRHIKSIVQPEKVLFMDHTHFAVFKGRNYTVDEEKNPIDNTYALVPCCGKAFTRKNYRSVFRINHYYTRSIEDFRYKCERGYIDGVPNLDFSLKLKPFLDLPLKEDRQIARFADIVREKIERNQ